MTTISPRIQFLITAHVIRLIPSTATYVCPLNTPGKLYNLPLLSERSFFEHIPENTSPHPLAVVQSWKPETETLKPWCCSAFQRISGWHSSHVRVLWTYLCRIWEHFILINIIHALVHSFEGYAPAPQPSFTTQHPTRVAELSKVERHEKFVTVVDRTCEGNIKESIR